MHDQKLEKIDSYACVDCGTNQGISQCRKTYGDRTVSYYCEDCIDAVNDSNYCFTELSDKAKSNAIYLYLKNSFGNEELDHSDIWDLFMDNDKEWSFEADGEFVDTD